MKSNRTHIVKIGKLGSLTLCLPEMEGRYMLIEQNEGHLTLRPVDLELNGTHTAAGIAQHETAGQCVFLPAQGTVIARA